MPPAPKDGEGQGRQGGRAAPPPLQPAPADVPLVWRNDFLKAQNQADLRALHGPGRAGQDRRLGGRLPAGRAEGRDRAARRRRRARSRPTYPFEDIYFTDLRATAGQPLKLTRAFAVPPGAYDVYVALRERTVSRLAGRRPGEGGRAQAGAGRPGLSRPTSSRRARSSSPTRSSSSTSPLAPDAQKERPYVLGDSEIVPAADHEVQEDRRAAGGLPDLRREVRRRTRSRTSRSSTSSTRRTPPARSRSTRRRRRRFSAQTLPPNFDPALGHQLVAGQAVPLSVVPGRRLPARDQDHGQQGAEEPDARRALHGRARVLGLGRAPGWLQARQRTAEVSASVRGSPSTADRRRLRCPDCVRSSH